MSPADPRGESSVGDASQPGLVRELVVRMWPGSFRHLAKNCCKAESGESRDGRDGRTGEHSRRTWSLAPLRRDGPGSAAGHEGASSVPGADSGPWELALRLSKSHQTIGGFCLNPGRDGVEVCPRCLAREVGHETVVKPHRSPHSGGTARGLAGTVGPAVRAPRLSPGGRHADPGLDRGFWALILQNLGRTLCAVSSLCKSDSLQGGKFLFPECFRKKGLREWFQATGYPPRAVSFVPGLEFGTWGWLAWGTGPQEGTLLSSPSGTHTHPPPGSDGGHGTRHSRAGQGGQCSWASG